MSGSKGTNARVSGAQRRRQEAEAARQREEVRIREEARRKEMDEIRRRERVRELQDLAAETRAWLTGALTSDAAKLVSHQLDKLRELTQAAEIGTPPGIEALKLSQKLLERAFSDVKADLAAAERALSAQRERVASRLEVVDFALASLATNDTSRYDPAGAIEVGRLLHRARSRPVGPALEAELVNLEFALQAHSDAVQAGLAAHLENIARAEEVLVRWRDGLAALQADEVAMAWCQPRILDLQARINRLAVLLSDEKPEAVITAEPELSELRREIEERAWTHQTKEKARDYIIGGLMRALRKDDFAVDAPVLVGSLLEGDVVLRARRPDGQSLRVGVSQSGTIQYEIGDLRSQTYADETGREFVSCDDAERLLEGLHRTLASEYDIVTDGLWWEGKDPKRINSTGNTIPGSGHFPGRRFGAGS